MHHLPEDQASQMPMIACALNSFQPKPLKAQRTQARLMSSNQPPTIQKSTFVSISMGASYYSLITLTFLSVTAIDLP